MKKLTFILLLVGMTGLAQVKGNKNITSKTITISDLTDLEMALYADVEIDQSATATMTITTDSNLLEFIDTEIVDGTMKLVQKEWIQPSQNIKITIGAPLLKRLQVEVHETVVFKNIQLQEVSLIAILGKIKAAGTTTVVNISGEAGTIDASALQAKEAYINVWGDGKAIVNASQVVDGKLDKEARVKLIQQPAQLKGDVKQKVAKTAENTSSDKATYIDIKIKNNSWNRNHFVVKGPKNNGGHFGYGFPMMPGAVKKERWTIGTKVYKVNKIGIKKLLITITAENKGEVIKLFKS
jgi:hypothetical protein